MNGRGESTRTIGERGGADVAAVEADGEEMGNEVATARAGMVDAMSGRGIFGFVRIQELLVTLQFSLVVWLKKYCCQSQKQ